MRRSSIFLPLRHLCFNPRTPWDATRKDTQFMILNSVSIHAPTWDATQLSEYPRPFCRFNPRTHMGCDILLCTTLPCRRRFNPRTTWDATVMNYPAFNRMSVSIHAPTWDATCTYCSCLQLLLFQSTHPHGMRLLQRKLQIISDMFQSTHPHGMRPFVLIYHRVLICFNPRTHMGCDPWRITLL